MSLSGIAIAAKIEGVLDMQSRQLLSDTCTVGPEIHDGILGSGSKYCRLEHVPC